MSSPGLSPRARSGLGAATTRAIVVAVACIVAGVGCGIPDYVYVPPPDVTPLEIGSAGAAGALQLAFRHPAEDPEIDPIYFEGYDIYYKLYSSKNEETQLAEDLQALAGASTPGASGLLTRGFRRVVTEDGTDDFRPTIDFASFTPELSPLTPYVFAIDPTPAPDDDDLSLRVYASRDDAEDPSGGEAPTVVLQRRAVDETDGRTPRFASFLRRDEYDPALSSGDDDLDSVVEETGEDGERVLPPADDPWGVVLYAVAIQRTADVREVESIPERILKSADDTSAAELDIR